MLHLYPLIGKSSHLSFFFLPNVAQPLRVWQQRQRTWCPVCWRLSRSAHAPVWGKGQITFLWRFMLYTELCTLCTPSIWVNCVHFVNALWFVCRYGGNCSLHFMPLILGLVVMQHSMCFGDWATVNWITSAQRYKTLPKIENMIMLVCSHTGVIVFNFVHRSEFQVPWDNMLSLTSAQCCRLSSFVVVGRSAVGRHQQSWAHTGTDLWGPHGYHPSHQEQAP